MSEQKTAFVNRIAEYGWVIEGGWTSINKPDYWVGSSAWSENPLRALRFARRQDAQQAADLMLAGVNVRICEHEWMPPQQLLQPSAAERPDGCVSAAGSGCTGLSGGEGL